jgi:hypothetical protein
MRSRASAALAACLFLVLPTAGCYQGSGETVNDQGPTGNGTDFAVGEDLLVQDATLVASPAGDRASLIMTIINHGEMAEALSTVKVTDAAAAKASGPIEVASGAAVKVGGGSEAQIVVSGLKVPAGSYAEVTLGFARAGSATESIAVVPAVGYYQGYGPAAAVSAAASSAASSAP